MTQPASQLLTTNDRTLGWARQVALVIGASLFIALCARVTVPLPFTPVPLTLQNFGVLLVGMVLGGPLGCAALVAYLLEGLAGLPVFNPTGPGGLAQLLGSTGGFLLAYPFAAGVAGWIFEKGKKTFASAAIAGVLAEIVLFAGGLSWLAALTHSFTLAIKYGLYWFVFAEIIKVMFAAAVASGSTRLRGVRP